MCTPPAVGLGRTSAGLARIAYVFGSSQCFRGLECGSSPTSGTCFRRSEGLWPSDCAQVFFYGLLRGLLWSSASLCWSGELLAVLLLHGGVGLERHDLCLTKWAGAVRSWGRFAVTQWFAGGFGKCLSVPASPGCVRQFSALFW